MSVKLGRQYYKFQRTVSLLIAPIILGNIINALLLPSCASRAKGTEAPMVGGFCLSQKPR